jgi:hypothetical protein
MRCDPDNMGKKFETTCSQGFDCTKFSAVVNMTDCVIASSNKCAKDLMNMNLGGNALACACNFVYWDCAKNFACTLQQGFRDACESTCLAKQCMREADKTDMSGASTSTNVQAGSLGSASAPGGFVIAALALLFNVIH